jgi:hypothetical protein
VALLDAALEATVAAEPVAQRLRVAVREGRMDGTLPAGADASMLVERAVAAGLLTPAEAALLARHRELVARVVRVDDFDADLGAALLDIPPPVTRHSPAVMQAAPVAAPQRAAA